MTSLLRVFAIAAFVLVSAGLAGAESCKVEKAAEVPLLYYRGTLAVPARVNNAALYMGLDTGAQTIVTPEASNRFDLPRIRNRTTKAIGVAGTTTVNIRTLKNFEFAGKLYRPLAVPIIWLPAPAALKNEINPLSGLIGGDLLSEYDLDLDLEGKVLSFYKVRGCAKVPLPWTEPFTEVPVKVTSAHMILLPVEVEGHRLSALLDTGATHFSITKRGAIKSGVSEAMLRADPLREISGAVGINKSQPLHRFQSVVIAGETFQAQSLQVMDARLPEGDFLVGLTYLTPRRVWISYSMGMLFIRTPKILSSLQLPQLPNLPAEIINPNPLSVPSDIPCFRVTGGKCAFGLGNSDLPLQGRCTPNKYTGVLECY